LLCNELLVTNHIPQTLVTNNVMGFAKWSRVASVTIHANKENQFILKYSDYSPNDKSHIINKCINCANEKYYA
jgi:hypothetical protein